MFVTHVVPLGPFVKIFGQVEKSEVIKVERCILQLLPFITTHPPPNLKDLKVGTICLGRFSDGVFYRLRITNVGINGIISVNYIDYGNDDVIYVSEIRELDFTNPNSAYLKNIPPQANEFILARIYGQWLPQNVELISSELCNELVDIVIEDHVLNYTIIGIKYKETDYTHSLVSREIGNGMPLETQKQVFLQNVGKPVNFMTLQSRAKVAPKQIVNVPVKQHQPRLPNIHQQIRAHLGGNFISSNIVPRSFHEIPNVRVRSSIKTNVPPILRAPFQMAKVPETNNPFSKPIQKSPENLSNKIVATQQQTSPDVNKVPVMATFKSNTLNVGTVHEVYVSYIEDGPNLFSVQLASQENELNEMMAALAKAPLNNLSQKPPLGMACVARFSVDNELYRAVIMNLCSAACQVAFVDYGDAELVSFLDIFEIPQQFLKQKSFAIKCTLSGYKDIYPITEYIKDRFKELVMEKKLTLKVTPLEGAPFVQYCELYDGNTNILNELKKSNSLLTFIEPPKFVKNFSDNVKVRYIESPQKFFVQLTVNEEDYDNMMDRLLLHCEKAKNLKSFKEGSICAAKFSIDDNEWYRAKIIKRNDNKVLIKYVDFGNVESVDKNLLKEIIPEFTILPCQAIECCLKGFENATTINDNARTQLEMISEGTNGNDRNIFKMIIIDHFPSGVPIVNLFDEKIDPPLNISKRLYKLSMPPKNFSNFNTDFNYSSKTNTTESDIMNSTSYENSRNDQMLTNKSNNSYYNKSRSDTNSEKSEKMYNTRSDHKINAFNKLKDYEFNKTGREFNNKRFIGGNEYNKREKYSNMKKLIPRFNKQLNNNSNSNNNNNNRGYKDKYTRDKNSSEGKKFDNSDTSGKFSTESKDLESSYKESSSSKTNSHKFELPVEKDEFIPLNTEFINPNICYNVRENILMAWWVSPHEFYVYYKNLHESLEKLMIDLQQFYKNKQSTNKTPEIGDSVIVRHATDKLFYRAKILNYNPEYKKCKVELVDFGNKTITTLDNVWEIEKKFIHLPRIAIRCSLINVVLRCDHTTIIDKIDLYINKNNQITCRFIKTENDIQFVDIQIDGVDLRESFIRDNLVFPLSNDINLQRLKGQTLLAEIIKVTDLLHFYVKLEGCDTILPCSINDINFIKQNPQKSIEFKKLYENNHIPIKIEYISMDNVLLVSPLCDLLNSKDIQTLYNVPILSNNFKANVVHIESQNTMYILNENILNSLNNFIEFIYDFYENNGEMMVNLNYNQLYAVKSNDGNWYRGIILNECENENVHVKFLDYGNTEIVSKTKIKLLEPEHYETSVFATKVYLPIESIDVNFIKTLQNLLLEKNVEVKILEYIHENWIVDFLQENQSLTEYLIKENLAKRISNEKMEEEIKKDFIKIKYIPYNEKDDKMIKKEEIEIIEILDDDDDDENVIEKEEEIKNTQQIFEGISAYVSHVDNPERFYIQLESELGSLNNLQQNIQIIALSLPNLIKIKEGSYCIAQYAVDDEWYRAKVIDHGIDVITIQFIDYGNTDVITKPGDNMLKILPDELFVAEPYAIPCSLPVEPKDSSEWCEEANNIFSNILDKTINFEYISKKGSKKYINLSCDGEDYTKLLVQKNLANERDVIKSGETCFISHINSLSEFYIQLEADTDNLELISVYLSNKDDFPLLETFPEGLICSALFPEDEEWYRAKILFHSERGTEVLFIDYGNTALTTSLRSLPEEIAELPILSKRCNLYLPKNITKWSEEAEMKFQELAAMGRNIFECEMYTPGHSITVDLYLDGNSVIEKLESLCKKQSSVNIMSESIVDDFFIKNPGNCNAGKICHIKSPNDFYIHFIQELDILHNIEQYIQTESNSLIKLTEKNEGMLCLARFPEDKKCYRAKITAISNDGCEVFFVDYGRISFAREFYVIPDKISDIDYLAKHFSLENSLRNKKWSAKATGLFLEICGNEETIFNIEIINKTSDVNTVFLYLNNRNINEELQLICPNESDDSSTFQNSNISSDDVSNELNNSGVEISKNILGNIIEDVNTTEKLLKSDLKEHCNEEISTMNSEFINAIANQLQQAQEFENKIMNDGIEMMKNEIENTKQEAEGMIKSITNEMMEQGTILNKEIEQEICIGLWNSLEKLQVNTLTSSDTSSDSIQPSTSMEN